MSRLIDSFLTFSRIERNRYSFHFKEVAAREIVDGAAAAVRERFDVPGCDFQTRVPEGMPPLMADADALISALVNLLENAFKYTGEEKRIRLGAEASPGWVAFTVEDNGIGLAPREAGRVFRRFYRADNEPTRSRGGCGLGLSIVRFIVSAHRGEVRVESQPGQGSAFTVRLPEHARKLPSGR